VLSRLVAIWLLNLISNHGDGMAKQSIRRITKTIVDTLTPGETAWDKELKGFGCPCRCILTDSRRGLRRELRGIQIPHQSRTAAVVHDWTAWLIVDSGQRAS